MTDRHDGKNRSGGGSDRQVVTIQLTVPEMDCPSCAQTVEKGLRQVAGVVDSTPQPTAGTLTVSYDPELAAESDVVEGVENAGYEVLTGGDGETASDSEAAVAPPAAVWTGPRAITTWIGAGFLTLGLLFEFLVVGQPLRLGTPLGVEVTLADSFFLGAILSSGLPVLRGGYASLQNRSLDVDLLMGTAIIAATAIGYFVEAATLAVLFSLAELLEASAMDTARNSLRELMELSPDEATIRRDGETVTVPASEVGIDETVIVRPGETIPLDGTVVDGESAVDESPITGESVPVDKRVGDEVYAGSLNETGYLEYSVDALASESTLATIVEMVHGAEAKQTDKEQFVDRLASYYTPTIVILAILTATLPPLFVGEGATITVAGFSHLVGGSWQTWFVRGLTLLVIGCPCAFVISTPVSVVSGITSAAKNGVLVKGGTHLEAMGEVDVLAVDKTGTLTTGELAVTDLVPLGATTDEHLLQIGAALERRSEHPIADAIVARADEADLGPEPTIEAFESLTGNGVRAELNGRTYYAGKPALFEELGFDLSQGYHRADGGPVRQVSTEHGQRDDGATLAHGSISAFEGGGKTVVLVGTATELLGVVALADETRPGATRTVEQLHDLGVAHVVMLTGDNQRTARVIAEAVGVDDVHAELLPAEKVEAVSALQEEYGDVAMVGDGINDAPALASADVGIAMGAAGTDAALETADIALLGDDITRLPYLRGLSTAANGVIRQNVWASLGVKALLAVGVPFGLVSVALAVIVGDMGMSLGVTGNAMRLSRLAPDRFVES